MDVFKITKQKLKDIDVSDEEIQMALDEIEWVIINYCNVCAVPDALYYTWSNMAVDLLRFQFVTNSGDSVNFTNASSIKVGDATVNFENSTSSNIDNISKALASHLPTLDNLVLNYKEQLQNFRKIRW